ncbi:MAG TPA: amino acid transporter [Aeromicrobium sp.]|nr:amino acid transporter [Aeromicrobium sp.]
MAACIDVVTAVVSDPSPVSRWLMQPDEAAEQSSPERHASWWRVMCLTGVDYFSTLGYQPGIAALAAGALAPIATVVLVLLTLFGALPVYRRVAAESPHGQGSIAMLERLLPFWKGKVFVLVLLGFAATDFMITITLSAADAAAHVVENPHVPAWFDGREVLVTLVLVAVLGVVFLRGFSEAIGVAVVLVITYLVLNAIVIGVSFMRIAQQPSVIGDWKQALVTEHGNPLMMIAMALILFPKLALGMSGFETGVAVMTHVKGDDSDTEEDPAGRIRNTRKLLTAAALIMSVYLIASTVVTIWLIPAAEFKDGGSANGRALAYLAHLYLGDTFGTVYDLSTIAILWFAGASAMAGLLNLVPRYLPRYGMAPEWSAAVRPLVLVLTAIAFGLTWIFDADVDAQGGAYATGVLVLFTSASVAVALAARKAGQRRLVAAFIAITAVLLFTTASNVIERPDGVKIASFFIAAIIVVSVGSRFTRALELRTTELMLDDMAQMFVDDLSRRTLRFVANEPDARDSNEYREKVHQIIADNDLEDGRDIIFVEVTVTDPSDFESVIDVHGCVMHERYRVLTIEAASVPNAIAALLLHVRDTSRVRPHIYFEWTEGNPLINLVRFMLFGVGEVAPVTREILRRSEPDREQRPHVHVG